MKIIPNIFKFLKYAMKDSRLTGSEYRILSCISFLSGYENIFPSLEYISEQTGIKRLQDISFRLNKLKKLNYISIQRRQRQTNIYKLNFDILKNSVEKEKSILEKLHKPEIRKKDKAGDPEKYSMSIDPVHTLEKDLREVTSWKFNGNEKQLDTLINSNKENIETYKKYLMLLYLIGKIAEKKGIKNKQAYLFKSFQNQSYSEYHKEVFETKINYEHAKQTNRFNSGRETKQQRITNNIRAMQEFTNKICNRANLRGKGNH